VEALTSDDRIAEMDYERCESVERVLRSALSALEKRKVQEGRGGGNCQTVYS